jgi:hypothetical protein
MTGQWRRGKATEDQEAHSLRLAKFGNKDITLLVLSCVMIASGDIRGQTPTVGSTCTQLRCDITDSGFSALGCGARAQVSTFASKSTLGTSECRHTNLNTPTLTASPSTTCECLRII